MLLGLLLVMSIVGRANAVMTVTINVTSPLSHDPAAVGETTSTTLSVTLINPTPNPRMTTWTVQRAQRRADPADPWVDAVVGTYRALPATIQGSPATFNFSFSTAGYWKIPVEVWVRSPESDVEADIVGVRVIKDIFVTVQDVVVRFAAGPIKTGYTLPVADSAIKKTVTATVVPAAEAANITLVVTGQPRATIPAASIVRNTTAGTVTFDVRGTSETPDDGNPQTPAVPDTFVEGHKNGVSKGSAPVLVVVPKRIGTPLPEANSTVTGVNRVLDRYTSPASFPPAGYVRLETIYVQWLMVPVDDQCGNRLDSLYTGVFVSEDGKVTNQPMRSDGTYQDPVGFGQGKEPGPSEVLEGSAAALAWPTDAPMSLPPIGYLQREEDISVSVGGHSLDPAVVGRYSGS